MLPSERFANCFPQEIRHGGEALVPNATRLWGGDESISLEFSDGTNASFQLENNLLVPHCSCETALAGNPCTHLWCALLLADKFQDLAKALKRSVPRRLHFPTNNTEDSPRLEYDTPRRRKKPEEELSPEAAEALNYLAALAHGVRVPETRPEVDSSLTQEILYVVRPDKQRPDQRTCPIETWWRTPAAPGQKPSACRPFTWEAGTPLPTKMDATLLGLLTPFRAAPPEHPNLHHVPASCEQLFEALIGFPNLRWADAREGTIQMHPLALSFGTAADLHIACRPLVELDLYEFTCQLAHTGKDIPFSEVRMQCQAPGRPAPPAWLLCRNQLLRANLRRAEELSQQFLLRGTLRLDYATSNALSASLATQTDLDTDSFPEALRHYREDAPPIGHLYVRTAQFKYQGQEQLHAELSFQYGNITCEENDPNDRILDGRALIQRDPEAEEHLRDSLRKLGFRYNSRSWAEELGWKLLPSLLDNAVMELIGQGWEVRAEGKTYRKPQTKQAVVSSGTDWFDLKSGISFDGMEVPLPTLLAAAKQGQHAVRLDDGTYGILPREWLENFTVLTELGEVTSDRIRLRVEQAALVNAILNDQLAHAGGTLQERLEEFERLGTPQPADPPHGFQATLRPYQRVGLGWLLAMQKAGMGACLADDRGLGKTIQVLAVLAGRALEPNHTPSLIVMPRSLLFNWQAEAQKFAPWLRVRIHLGNARDLSPRTLASCDLLLTTYGTLRNDATRLANVDFDYCVLDESQAIKNPDSATARAARCIRARHRIAMTGTPIENHLGELFSQLDFLNPALFGNRRLPLAPSPNSNRENSAIERVRKGVRPFLLRRTKQDVAKDLPPKTEQILWCEMPPEDLAEYNDLLHYYQKELSEAESTGMQTLAALTRLRQAACHPGLLKENRFHDSSAKLEILLQNLDTILEAGNKALVFSQFTSFLKIIRARLQDAGYNPCYLDGETKDRAAEVDAFQNDPARQVFLISLKAGGVGLNLTAASYVFLMDPWWNPAAEAQAIDRAYRIGQKNPVFAYRIITRSTIEEKVYNLQNAKRKLASAIIDHDTDSPAPLSRKDLQALLF
ncbi:MAG: SNF2 helicase associated domain-containing protein [Victivallales bacterium]|nr:SNF2 helicase associated domain-containing protein [Victivallales bacterium]